MTQENLAAPSARVIGRDGDLQWFEFGLDPSAAEALGREVAEKLRAANPDAVLCFEHEEDAVLAHIVARQLGATRVVLREQEGLLWLSHELEPGSRVAVIAVEAARMMSREVLQELLQARDARLVDIAVLEAGEPAALEWGIRDA